MTADKNGAPLEHAAVVRKHGEPPPTGGQPTRIAGSSHARVNLQNYSRGCGAAAGVPGKFLVAAARAPTAAARPFDPETDMKLITAIVRAEQLPDVKIALFRAGVTGMTLTRVSGHGGEQEMVQQYRAECVVLEFHEKVKIEMAVSEPFVEPTIRAVLSAARTGQVGDGKIFVQPLERVIRIRTAEMDNAALTPVTAELVQRAAQVITAGAE
jgi:nitrogen regulatory protein P-II 1